MGVDAALESDKFMRHSYHNNHYRHGYKIKESYAKGKPPGRNYLLSPDDNFTELSFTSPLSPSPKSLPPKTFGMTSSKELKRGSIYQSSEAVRKMTNLQVVEGRQKLQSLSSSDTSLSFTTMDSPLPLPCQNEASPGFQRKKALLNSLNVYLKSSSPSTPSSSYGSLDFQDLSFDLPEQYLKDYRLRPVAVTAGDGSPESFLEICLHAEDTDYCCGERVSELEERSLMEEPKLEFDGAFSPENDGNGLLESASVFVLPQSPLANLSTPNSPCESKSNQSKAAPKALPSPIRRILSPIIKSKSLRIMPTLVTEMGGSSISSPARIRRTTSLHKSLMQEFSKTTKKSESDGKLDMNDSSGVASISPAHLRGLLRLVYKHGVPFFEFSLKDPEDVLAAKSWRTDNAFNWVYTFHSVNSKKKSNSGVWGRKDRYKQSSVVGQMQVSSYLCSEMSDHGSLENSVVTEFVLFDIAQARKSFSAKGNSSDSPSRQCIDYSTPVPKGTINESYGDLEPEKCKFPTRHGFGYSNCEAEAPYPWVPPNLYPHLEVAAMVIRFPFERRERLKGKHEDMGGGDGESPNLFNFSSIDQSGDIFSSDADSANVKVVIPSGIHGLPTGEEGGPSPLLDRWRSGGGCDCGGWDMACPIVVFDSCSLRNGAGIQPMENQRPLELFAQGGREKTPALTLTTVGEGVYSVDFHAQLSKLQAFSICVGILHGAEVSTAVGQERNRQMLHCNSLKVILEEEMRCLIEAVAEEDRRKMTKKMGEIPTFVLDPPVSPIGRV